MKVFIAKAHTVKGKRVYITASITGRYMGVPIIDIKQMDDTHWNRLAEKNKGTVK